MESITFLRCELNYGDNLKFWFTCKTEPINRTYCVVFTVHKFLWFFIVKLESCEDIKLLEHTAAIMPKVLKSLRKAPFRKYFS